MSGRYFLDTNVFVYSFDPLSPLKKRRATQLIEDALSENAGFISTQVAQEFLNVGLRKFDPALTPSQANAYLQTVLGPLCEIFPTLELYRQALDLRQHHGFEWYDALIVTAALEGGAAVLYSEDLHDGQKLDGLTIRNPFR